MRRYIFKLNIEHDLITNRTSCAFLNTYLLKTLILIKRLIALLVAYSP